MSGTYSVVVGDKGRIVLPAGLRDRLNLAPGTPLLLVDTDDGVVMTTRAQALRLLREQLDGVRLVPQLLQERRQASLDEDR